VSNGLAVFTTSTSILSQVNAGDIVSLTGTVSEFRPAADPDYLLLTEVVSPANITVGSRTCFSSKISDVFALGALGE
jgi:predicted extracellular nuclease